ncbi:MAG TPA: hypothetical protein VGD45_11645 [Steroidobacter sp.]|uniref:hypothetical protein n=1 Tax=Steroidobacter sp. TaxID=1978227 RepID=UPI002ED9E9D0
MGSEKQSCRDGRGRTFEPLRVSVHIESCRARTARLSNLAHAASQALHVCKQYEHDEPHLGTCVDVAQHLLDDVVRQLLDQVHTALSPLGIVSHDIDPQTRAMEIAVGCEAQRLVLDRARNLALATIYVLKSSGIEPADDTNEVVKSLRDLEEGIRTVLDGLHPATMSLPTPTIH